jgi:cytochrome c
LIWISRRRSPCLAAIFAYLAFCPDSCRTRGIAIRAHRNALNWELPGEMNRPMRLMLTWICFALLLSATATVRADDSPDKAGQALAQDYCSACHRVSAQQSPPPKVIVDTGSGSEEYEAPSFRQVATRAGRDGDYLRTFIRAPHYPMREQLFIPEELDQIVTYILSLKADEGDW